jgi:TonB-linked SusC/RagA family outer membrane protein
MGLTPFRSVVMVLALAASTAAPSVAQTPFRLATRTEPVMLLQLDREDARAKGALQRITLQVAHETLENALAEIGQLSGLRIMFGEDVLKSPHRVTLLLRNQPALEVLEKTLQGTGLTSRFLSPNAILVKKADVGPPPRAADGIVTGQVTAASTNQPIPGAAVVLMETTMGSTTDSDGRFRISGVPAGTYRIRVSVIGYAEAEQSVTVASDQTATVSFSLIPQAVQLEAVVAIGYGTARKQDVTGSVASVNANQIKEMPSPSVGEGLKGRVAGVDIQTSDYKPGANPTIRIRGSRSITAGNDPLVVVDGVAIAGGLGDINPQSIESVDVLKDASATAVYGSRGANGVVLITTKHGRAGETRFTYDASYGQEKINSMVSVYDGAGFAAFKREAYRAAGKYNCPAGVLQCATGDAALFTAQELDGIAGGSSTNYPALITRTGAIQNHQLSMTGGSANTHFAAGVNFIDEQGVTIGQDYIRRGANIAFDHTRGRLKAGLSANVSNSLQNLGRGDGLWDGAMQINPLAGPYDADGNLVGTPIPDGQMWNPLLDAQNWKRDNLRTRTFGNAFIEYELLSGVQLRTTFGTDLLSERQGEFRGMMTQPNRGGSNNAWVDRSETFNYVSTTALQVDRQITDASRISATVLYELQSERYDHSRADVVNLPYEYQLYQNLSTAGTVTGVSSGYTEWLLQSGMGRLNYALHDRYYLTVTGRQDCSSRLAEGNKCSFFPSAALKWRLSDEGFMQNQGLFSDLSLRASYGRTGNTSIAPYQTQGSLTKTTYAWGDAGAYGFRPGTLANPGLGWEKTDQLDVGLEYSIWDGRLSGTADYYRANTSDLLLSRQLPPGTGFSSVLENIGATRNTGYELSLSTVNIENWHGLNWTSALNFSTSKNEIVTLYGGKEDDIGNKWFIGKPINVFYEYQFDGIWQADQADDAAVYQQKPGEIRVVDQNGDGKINADDRVIVGRHNNFPRWTGSLSNRFYFGNFDLSGLITARWGYTINSSIYPGALAGRYNNVVVNYWTPDNPSNEYPRPNVDQERPIYESAVRLQNGSHWRVRSIALGYNVPPSLSGRLVNGSTLRIYAQSTDPYISTDFGGFDPEGGENIGTPSHRTLLVGAQVGF